MRRTVRAPKQSNLSSFLHESSQPRHSKSKPTMLVVQTRGEPKPPRWGRRSSNTYYCRLPVALQLRSVVKIFEGLLAPFLETALSTPTIGPFQLISFKPHGLVCPSPKCSSVRMKCAMYRQAHARSHSSKENGYLPNLLRIKGGLLATLLQHGLAQRTHFGQSPIPAIHAICGEASQD